MQQTSWKGPRVELLESALQEAERLAVANSYAAAVMHEVNNPLEAITNLVYLLREEQNLSLAARGYIDLIQDQLTVLAAVTRPSLAFYREQKVSTVVNLHDILASVEKLHGRRLRQSGIALHTRCPEKVICEVVGSELLQLLSNFVINAIDALTASGSGSHIFLRVHCTPGSVYLLVADDGPGIPAHIETTLFDAHVTAKPNGSGLGLWISKRIIQNHGGKICYRTCRREGRSGTAFRILLPCSYVS